MTTRAVAVLCVYVALGVTAGAQSGTSAARPAATGVIAGTVTDAVSHTALSGVLVELGAASPGPGTPASAVPRRRQVSDAKGRYAFSGLPAGIYQARATVGGTANAPNGFIQNSSGFPITPYLAGGFGPRVPGGLIRPLALADGESFTADIVLWPTGVIGGTVTDDSGDPLVEAVVGAVRVTSDGRLTNGPSARTDDRGAYRLSGLAPGRYIVYVPIAQTATPVAASETAFKRFEELRGRNLVSGMPPPNTTGQRIGDTMMSTSATGWITGAQPLRLGATATLALPTTFFPGQTVLNIDNAVALKAGEERTAINIVVKPEPTQPVSGTLTFNGAGAAGYFVRILPAGSVDGELFEVARAQTDAQGRFVFPAVPLGNYALVATSSMSAAFSVAPGVAPPPRPGPASWVRTALVVDKEPVPDVVLAFRPGLEMRGRVAFSGGTKPAEAVLKTIRVSFPGVMRVDRVFEEPPIGMPDPSGAFGPVMVSPGRYVVRLMTGPPAPWQLMSVLMNGREVAEQPVELTEDVPEVVVTFTDRPASVSVTVNASGDAAPIVMLFPSNPAVWPDLRAIPGRVMSARVGRDGRASFSNVLPGDYLAIAMSEVDAETFPDAAFVRAIAPLATSVAVNPSAPTGVSLSVRTPR